MSKHKVENIRNIVVCGHGAAGKTTLVDRLLVKTGTVNRPASVDDRTSICDFDEEEKQHRYTIESTLVRFEHGGKLFQVLDTPGYPDYIGQTIGAMRAADTVAIVIDAHSGIQVNTRRVWNEAAKEGLGRMIVLSKMDGDNIDFPALLRSIRELFGPKCIPFNVPVGSGHDFKGVLSVLHPPGNTSNAAADPALFHEPLIEAIIEVDEKATEQYFEGKEPVDAEIPRLIVEAVSQGTLVPIVCLSTRMDLGVTEFLDALAVCTLPADKHVRMATNAKSEEVVVGCDENGPLAAQVFKTRIDPFVQKLSFVRIFSGRLKKDDSVHVSGARKNVKISQLLEVQANETHAIDSAGPGEIVAVAKNDELHTGTSLGDFTMLPMKFPTPMVSLAATPKTRGDEAKLSGALHKIVEEDSTFHTERDPQTHELVITGMSELHLQVIRERLKRRDKVEVETHQPKIPYRETIATTAEGSYRHKKQSGGRGQFGEVHIRMFPLPGGTKIEEFTTKARFPSMREFHYDPENNFLWVDSIVGGSIPNNFLPAIEKGFKERMSRGVIANCRVVNLAIEVHFGKYHDVDSSEAAFKTAGSMAFRNVFQQAKPCLLEPVVKLHVTVPSGKLGDISSDFSGRRGRVQGMESAGGDLQTVTAEVPLAEVITYARSLSSLTGGQGSYTMEFSHFDVVPGNIQREIMEKTVHKEEEEE